MKLKNIFTRILAACLLLALLACAVACGGEDTPSNETDTNTVENTAASTEDTGDVTEDNGEGQTTDAPADPDAPYNDGISDDTAADIF